MIQCTRLVRLAHILENQNDSQFESYSTPFITIQTHTCVQCANCFSEELQIQLSQFCPHLLMYFDFRFTIQKQQTESKNAVKVQLFVKMSQSNT